MENVKQAVDDVRKLTRYFASLNSLCVALDGIASIEQAASEAEQRVARFREEQITVEAAIDTARAQADQVTGEARIEADNIVARAKSQAGNIMVDAENKAAEMISAAQKTEAEIVECFKALKAENDTLSSQIAAGRDELADIERRLASAREERDRLLKA